MSESWGRSDPAALPTLVRPEGGAAEWHQRHAPLTQARLPRVSRVLMSVCLRRALVVRLRVLLVTVTVVGSTGKQRCAQWKTLRQVASGHESFGGRYAERPGKTCRHDPRRRGVLTVLETSKIRPVHARQTRELSQGQASVLPRSPKPLPKLEANVHLLSSFLALYEQPALLVLFHRTDPNVRWLSFPLGQGPNSTRHMAYTEHFVHL